MAIKISGSTIIDDSRNIVSAGIATATTFSGQVNAGVGTITTLTSTTVTATSLNATGVITATTFSGNLSGNVTGNVTGTASTSTFAGTAFNLVGTASTASFATTSFGLSGSPNILVTSAGVNTTSAPTKLYVQGNAAGSVVGLGTTDANTTLDFSTANNFSLTLTGSIVLNNPTGVTTGQSGVVYIQQDGSGSRTCGFGSHWDFPNATAPTLSTGANALDVLAYSVRTSTSIVAAALIGIGTL